MDKRRTNGSEPAYPLSVAAINGALESSIDWLAGAGGLTKREHFAALAMQGLIAEGRVSDNEIPELAVWIADKMIDRLNGLPAGENKSV